MDEETKTTLNCQGLKFTPTLLIEMLTILNRDGEVTVRAMEPGSVNLLVLGATLVKVAEHEAAVIAARQPRILRAH